MFHYVGGLVRPRSVTISLAILIPWIVFAGCEDKATIWSTESRSPDGGWIAKARTDQWGGPGTAAVISSVSLQRTEGARNEIEVLELWQDSYPIKLTLRWLTPTHLEVAYRGSARVDFQAIRCAGIDISVSDTTRMISSQ
jgi:hypothetical protein